MRVSVPRRPAGAVLVLTLSVLAAACGASGSTAAPATAAPATAAPATPAPTAAASAAASGEPAASPDPAIEKVSANTASIEDITAALQAAGVPNADRWAREIEEYRPYPADDPSFQKLRDELAKYNPDATTLAGILAVLEP